MTKMLHGVHLPSFGHLRAPNDREYAWIGVHNTNRSILHLLCEPLRRVDQRDDTRAIFPCEGEDISRVLDDPSGQDSNETDERIAIFSWNRPRCQRWKTCNESQMVLGRMLLNPPSWWLPTWKRNFH